MIESGGLRGRAGIVGFCRSLYVASVFVLNIGLARALGAEGFGSFQQVFIFSALFLVGTLGIPEALYFFLPRVTDEERPRFLGQTILILGVAGAVLATIMWFAAPMLARAQRNPAITGNIRIFGLYGAFIVASSFADPLFITFKRVGFLFMLNSIHAFFLFSLTAWFVWAGGTVPVLFSSLAVFGGIKYLLALVLLARMRPRIGPVRLFTGRSMILLLLSFSLPVMMSSTVEIISRWLDKYVVSFFFGTEALGIFFVGAIEIPFIGVIISSIYSVISPVLNTYHHEGNIRKFASLSQNTLKFTAKLIWPLFAWFIVFADHLIPLVFSGDYTGAVLPFRIYLCMMPLRIASFGVLVIAMGRPRVVFWSAAAALAVNFVLNIVLAMTVGFTGPAIATVVSSYFHVALLLVIILRALGIVSGDLLPFRHFFSVAVTCGFAVSIAYAVTYTMNSDAGVVFLSFAVFAAAYLFLGGRAGFIRFSDVLTLAGGQVHGQKPDSDNGG